MPLSEVASGSFLVLVLLGMSVYFGLRQMQALKRLRDAPDSMDEEHQLERRRARRRLVSCGLTLVLAALMVLLMVVFEAKAQTIADQREAYDAANAPEPTDEERAFLKAWGGTVIAILVLLLVVIGLAAVDLWETRRYGLKQMRKIQADRRAMIQRQAQRLREERHE